MSKKSLDSKEWQLLLVLVELENQLTKKEKQMKYHILIYMYLDFLVNLTVEQINLKRL